MYGFFSEPFLRIGLAVGLISGLLCTFAGFFAVLKRVVFIGIAISQAAGLGLVFGTLIGFSPYVSALVLSIGASLFFWLYNSEYDVPKETIVALIYVMSSALAIIIMATNPRIHTHGPDIISGNLLYVTMSDLVVSVTGGGFVLFILLYFYKQLLFVSYDRETALTSGIDGSFVDFIFYLLLGTIVSISVRTAGLLFVFASLILPVMTGLKLFTSVKGILFCSFAVTAISVLCGFIFSYMLDLPTSPLIVCFYGIFFILAALYRKARLSF